MKQIISGVLIVLLAAASTSWAQGGEGAEPSRGLRDGRALRGIDFKDAQNASRGLFTFRRFSMSHTMGVGINAGPAGGKYLYYLNTTAYRVTPKFTVFTGVGVQSAFGGRPPFGWPGVRGQEIVINYGLLYAPRPGAQIGFQMSHVIRRGDRTPPSLATSRPKLVPLARAHELRERSVVARIPGPFSRAISSPPTKPPVLQRFLKELQSARGGAPCEVAHPPEARPPEAE